MNQKQLDEIKTIEDAFEAAPKGINNTGEYLEYLRGVVFGELIPEIERLQAEVAACDDYVRGRITLGELERLLTESTPITYQQKPVEEWVTPERGES